VTEPDVALTDYALVVECAAFAWLVARRGAPHHAARGWVVLFFAATSLAAFFGGTLHGFFAGEGSRAGAVLWTLSLLSIGATAFSGTLIGAHMTASARAAGAVRPTAATLLVAYVAVVLFVADAFLVAIVAYLAGASFLLVAFVRRGMRTGSRSAMRGAWGLVLSFAGAAIQQLQIGVHPLYFNHNALYHVVQAVALALIYFGCRGLLEAHGGLHADTT
jgi:hypothetical protein